MSPSQLTKSYFSEGLVETTNQMRILYPHIWIPMIWDDQGPLELLLPAKIAEFGEIEGSQCMYVCLCYVNLFDLFISIFNIFAKDSAMQGVLKQCLLVLKSGSDSVCRGSGSERPCDLF